MKNGGIILSPQTNECNKKNIYLVHISTVLPDKLEPIPNEVNDVNF